MVADTTLARGQDDLTRAGTARALVQREGCGGIVGFRAERRREHTAVLDRLARALPQVREHRVRGVAEHRDTTTRPLRDRVLVVEGPLVPEVPGREDSQERLVPAAIALEHLAPLALGDPRLVPV